MSTNSSLLLLRPSAAWKRLITSSLSLLPLASSSSSSSSSSSTTCSCYCYPLQQCRRYSSKMSRTAMRFERMGVGPDGKPLPIPNTKKVHPRMYRVLMVNQDGSSYTIRHRTPHRIVTLPLDLSTLTPEQLAERERVRQAAKARVYVEEEFEEEEEGWSHDQYRDLL